LDYIHSLGASGMKFGLTRIKSVLSGLGDPQNDFPSVHIAGTNGKGSVGALLHSVLGQAGLRVGFYSSPHLERLNERFKINKTEISNVNLGRLTDELRRKLANPDSRTHGLTQFEFLTVLAFLWFSQEKVDLAIVETGLGGRLDATNALQRVLLTVITSIGYDHTSWLGTSLPLIALEKAGIIKKRVPVVTGAVGQALKVIQKVAVENDSPFLPISKRDPRGSDGISLSCGLRGNHQVENARVAYTALQNLDHPRLRLSPRQIQVGFSRVRWPGRYEKISRRLCGQKRTIVLDGAHNPQAIEALVATLKRDRSPTISLLFGALKDKDIASMIKKLSPLVKRAAIVPLPSDRSEDPQRIVSLWRGNKNVHSFSSIGRGWRNIINPAERCPIVVTGSLYLVGAIRKKILRGAYP